jgi:hypothetical protein
MIYDNLTDDELLRVADGQAGLIKALAERLEMRLRDIEDQNKSIPVEDDRQLKLF